MFLGCGGVGLGLLELGLDLFLGLDGGAGVFEQVEHALEVVGLVLFRVGAERIQARAVGGVEAVGEGPGLLFLGCLGSLAAGVFVGRCWRGCQRRRWGSVVGGRPPPNLCRWRLL